MLVADIPDDLMLATDAARETGVDYFTLRNWWTHGRIESWLRGPSKRRMVSRSQVEREWQREQSIVPASGEGEQPETDS